jgi:type VI secretion system secreted protein VgrG
VINGGGSYAKFTASGIEHGTNGTFVAHAATHSFVEAKHMEAKVAIPAQGGHDPKGSFNFSA